MILDCREAAGQYASKGFSVVLVNHVQVLDEGVCICSCLKGAVCGNAGKHPRSAWKQKQSNRASPEDLDREFRAAPLSNVGIVTGAISGCFVLDCDPRHGGTVSLDALIGEHGSLPDTVTCTTGGGGTHYYFAHPGPPVKNDVNVAPGLDVRGDGGFVVTAPSLHASGRRYEWQVEHGIGEIAMAPAPAWLMGILAEGVGGATRRSTGFDLLEALNETVKEGTRDSRLAQFAGSYFGRGYAEAAVLEELRKINSRLFDPPLPESDVVKVCRSIGKKHAREQELAPMLDEKAPSAAAEWDQLSDDDRLGLARMAWSNLGVDGVIGWSVYLNDRPERADFVLETERAEIAFGHRLNMYQVVDTALLVEGSTVLKASPKEWRQSALMLRRMAAEIHAEQPRAMDRLQDWLEAYYEDHPVQDAPDIEQREDWLRREAIRLEGKVHLRPHVLAGFLEMRLRQRMPTKDLCAQLRRSGWMPTKVRAGQDGVRLISVWREP